MFSLRTPFCRDAVIQAPPFCRENLVSLYNLRGHDPTRVISRGMYYYIKKATLISIQHLALPLRSSLERPTVGLRGLGGCFVELASCHPLGLQEKNLKCFIGVLLVSFDTCWLQTCLILASPLLPCGRCPKGLICLNWLHTKPPVSCCVSKRLSDDKLQVAN